MMIQKGIKKQAATKLVTACFLSVEVDGVEPTRAIPPSSPEQT